MRALVLILALALSGCASSGFLPNKLQLSKETMPFPERYQREAARVVQLRGGDRERVTVSYPRTTIGQTAQSPQRWYVCVRGLTPPPVEDGLPTVEEFAGTTLNPAANSRLYDVLLFFPADGALPSVRDGYDSSLCRDGAFERLTAEPPLT